MAINLRLNGKKKLCQLSRLIMFHFGKHQYENIDDMPKIIFLDDNPLNVKLENLKFATAKEIVEKTHRLYPNRIGKKKVLDTPVNIKIIKTFLKQGKTQKI